MTDTFLIRCDANKKNGFGHFSRCLNIARGIKHKLPKATIVFLGDYNNVAAQLIGKYKMLKQEHFDSIDDEMNFTRDFDNFILDNYFIDQDYIDRYCTESMKFIKIDDFNDLNLKNVEVVVNFCLRGNSFNYGSKTKCLGLKYFPVREEFKKIRLKNISQFKNRVDNILVFLGAADQHNSSHTMVKLLDKVLNNVTISLISAHEESPIHSSFNNNKIKYLPLSPFMEKYFEKSDVVITGGGLTKYECAYNCIPNASLTQTIEQDEEVKTFSEAGLTYYLGMAESLDFKQEEVIKKLHEFFSKKIRRSLFDKGKYHFSTESTQRLVNSIL